MEDFKPPFLCGTLKKMRLSEAEQRYLSWASRRGGYGDVAPWPPEITSLLTKGLIVEGVCTAAERTLYGRELCKFVPTTAGKKVLSRLKRQEREKAR